MMAKKPAPAPRSHHAPVVHWHGGDMILAGLVGALIGAGIMAAIYQERDTHALLANAELRSTHDAAPPPVCLALNLPAPAVTCPIIAPLIDVAPRPAEAKPVVNHHGVCIIDGRNGSTECSR
jgi:hypothetical protein